MLCRRVRRGLCQHCRNDLLSLFEHGFASSSTSTRVPRRQFHKTFAHLHPSRGISLRRFSSRHGLCNSRERSDPPPEQPSPDADSVAQVDPERREAIEHRPRIPRAGDLDQDDLEHTAQRVEEIAHDVWSTEKQGASENMEAAGGALDDRARDVLEDSRQDVQEIESLEEHRDELLDRIHWDSDFLQGRTDSDYGEEALQQDRDERLNRTQQDLDALADAASSDTAQGLKEDGTQNDLESRDPVEVMRDSDGSVEDVVREARQLHGEYLPEGVLSEEEFKSYQRLYGDPLEKVEGALDDNSPDAEEGKEVQELLDQEGQSIHHLSSLREYAREEQVPLTASEGDPSGIAKSLTERAMEVAEYIGGEVRAFKVDEVAEDEVAEKGHPLTVLGRFHTSPRTTFLPQETFVQPVQKILAEHSNKHVKEMSERLFGGPGLPDSPLTPRIGRILPQKAIPLDASQHGMGTMEANAYVSIIWPSTYAAVSSVLVETRKRLGSSWLRNLMTKEGGASVLDAGGGGVGILTWRDVITAEWNTLHSSDATPPPPPLGKSTVLTGADNLRYRAASLLENTTFLPRLPDYVHIRDGATLGDDRPAPQRKQFDVIIAPHTLWPLGEEWQRKQQVQNLWSLLNPDGGVLILIEKGVPRGFEVIAGARELLLSRYIATADSPSYESRLESSNEEGTVQKGKGMIIAPCTNHAPCPMYTVSGVSRGRKDYCSFQQRYIRPPFLQRILGAKDRNHDDVDFSYIAVQRGRDLQDAAATDESVVQGRDATDSAFRGYEGVTAPENVSRINPLTFPRLVFPPLKRPGHVTIDVCTPAGKIDRWTISKSFSRAAYSDARKASWGDLWALGAKTRVPRNLQLGGEKSKKSKSPNERMKTKAKGILERVKAEKRADQEMAAEMERAAADEDDDDIDFDAVEVLKEIEQERGQRAKPSEQRQEISQKRSVPASKAAEVGKKPLSSPPRAKTIEYHRIQPTTMKPAKESTVKPEAHQPNNTEAPPPTSDLTLAPSEVAAISDFRAESRLDSLRNLSMDRLSRRSDSAKVRMRRGENKFREPEKEAWRAKMERRKEKKREEKSERLERREMRFSKGRTEEDRGKTVGEKAGRGTETKKEDERVQRRDTVEDVWGFDE